MNELALIATGFVAIILALGVFDPERDSVSRMLDAGTLIIALFALGCLILESVS